MKQENSQKGQTLIIIVFIMIAALAIGVSVSNRFITTLSITSDAYAGYQAQAVAEAAIENILTLTSTQLKEFIQFNSCGSYCQLEIVGPDGVVQTATVTLSTLGTDSQPFTTRLSRDEITEINLNGYGNNKTLSVCWNAPPSGELPSVYGILLRGTQGNYVANNYAYYSAGSSQINGFSPAVSANGYQNCMILNTGTNPQALRVRSIYNDVEVTVIPDSSATLPTQGILIESVGRVQDSVKTVSVIKSENMVPLDFDYILYQKSESEPLSN